MIAPDLIVIGGGLAGSEAAWQAAQRGLAVRLYEMRPQASTGAHISSNLAELVCSNSLGSFLPYSASGIVNSELRLLGSLLLECAEATKLPAGSALAVDRELFSNLVTSRISNHSHIEIIREEMAAIPTMLSIVASGPLTSKQLSRSISSLVGEEDLFFFDAISPIVDAHSINMEIAYRASRYGLGKLGVGDYINCPLTINEYDSFIDALLSAKRAKLHPFEEYPEQNLEANGGKFFEGCLPIETVALRSRQALTFGPMRPTGLTNPRTGRWPYALVQLRQDNLAGNLYSIVGFQTNLTYSEQKRVFSLIPGLEKLEFSRFGQMHRNTFIRSPRVLLPTLQSRARNNLLFAGQITGVEGYLGNIGTGLLAGINAARIFQGKQPLLLPKATMLGALCDYITHPHLNNFQPMKANFGILPPLEGTNRMSKNERSLLFLERSHSSLKEFLEASSF
jgi:methylenetetrahydrofolate--tRNA-(uracil-5-)-methyltransferase